MHDLDKGAQQGNKQRSMLTKIKVGEVAVVGRGANQGALQAIVKTADSDEEALLKQSFTEALMALGMGEKAEEFLEEAYKMNAALRSSMRSILLDPKVTEKKAAMKESLQQFASAMTSMVDDSDIMKGLEKAGGKTEGGKTYPAGDFAFVPDPAMPSTWKLRLTSEPGGGPDPRIVGAAIAALGAGYRGNKVQIPAEKRAEVISRVRAAWLKANPGKKEADLPDILKKSTNDKEDTEMSKELIDALNKKVDDLTVRLVKSELRGNMTDAHRAYYDGLKGDQQEAFGKASPAEREAIVVKANAGNETLTVDGTTIRKSDVGEGTFEILKKQQAQIDKSNADAQKERESRIQKELEVEAEKEFPHLAGTPVEKAELLKGIRAMPKEAADKQMAMLKSADVAMAKQLTELGQGGQGQTLEAEEKLTKLAKAKQEKDGITFEKAYDAILKTEEGGKLYEESLKAKKPQG